MQNNTDMVSNRKFKLIGKILKNTRLNWSLFKFAANLARHKLSLFKKSADRIIPYPTTMMLELTNKCNLHCITCPREYDYGREMHIGNMDTLLAKKVIDEALPCIQSIGLTGMGETLFAGNLLEIAKYIKSKKKGVITFISTNANIPDFIKRVRPVIPYIDTIQISTDGIGGVYESVRHHAKFESLKQNIEELVPIVRGKADIMFNMVLTKLNYTDMSNLIEFAHSMGVRYVNFTHFNLASVTDIDTSYYEFFRSEQFKNKLEEAKATAQKYPDVEVTGLDFQGNPGIRKCPLMWNHFQINHDGEVPPCCAKPFPKQYSFGNVSNASLFEVINSKKARAFRQQWINNKANKFCSKCHFVHL